MLNDARQRQLDLLIVWKLDRLSRSLKDYITILDELGHLRIDFVSYENQLDTSIPSGKLAFNIIGAVAESERDIIRERVLAGTLNVYVISITAEIYLNPNISTIGSPQIGCGSCWHNVASVCSKRINTIHHQTQVFFIL